MFRPVTSKIDLPKLDEDILKFWKENHIFTKSVNINKDSHNNFTLYEGPPTANGKPGIHHVLSRVFKDVIPRYKTMKGYYAPRKAGWDTHGLPVELEIEKQLGLSNKADIENYGIEKFNALCRESVFKYVKDWNDLTQRIGFWLDMDHPYVTLDNNYIESVWWALKQLWEKDLVYQGYKVTPHCPRCGTSLSSHEIALGYKDDTIDPSIYVKFQLSDKTLLNEELSKNNLTLVLSKPVYFLAWTTTPWTLPGNTGLAVSAKDDYSLLENESEYLILANLLIDKSGTVDYRFVASLKGETLVGLSYLPLYNPHNYQVERSKFNSNADGTASGSFVLSSQKLDRDLTYRVISADFVSMEDGTGIVHIAPAFGEADFEIGSQYGLDFVQPVNLDGKITGTYSFAGNFVKDADPLICQDLETRGLMHKIEKITHTYPFCWRCDAPVLYYAKKTWYIKTTAKKEELIRANAEINWYPEHIKYGRFGDWLQNNVDWAFSRERYWGTPLNAWFCQKCGTYEFVGSIGELKSKPGLLGLKEPLDMHRPYVDSITYNCTCGGEMKRFTEVIDCWFDSGAMPFSQWHYPFENTDNFNQRYPADYISEAIDQTRGWFYSLHAISILLNDKPCFKNVICLGHILDAEGEKMSKTKGNVIDPWSVLNKYGADATRWYLLTSGPPGNVKRFSSDMVGEMQRNFLGTLWNVYSFFVMYANIDKIDPAKINIKPSSELDLWILSSLNSLIQEVDTLLTNYDPTTAGRRIEKFVDHLSNWYIRRSRRRFWKSQNDNDKLSAYFTLYQCIIALIKLLAPFLPFITEEIYRNLVCTLDNHAPESIHLTRFPVPDASFLDNDLVNATVNVIAVCSLGRAARAKAGIKIRQPLTKVIIATKSESVKKGLERLHYQITEELNVKQVEIIPQAIADNRYVSVEEGDLWVAIDSQLTPELESEGIARELVRRLQVMRRSAGLDITDHIIIFCQAADHINSLLKENENYIKQETLATEIIYQQTEEGIYQEKHKLLSTEVLLGLKKTAA